MGEKFCPAMSCKYTSEEGQNVAEGEEGEKIIAKSSR